MNRCESGCHSCGFFLWLFAAGYDGKYRCKYCGLENKIPDSVRKKCNLGYVMIVLPFGVIASFLGVELGKLWIGLAGLAIGLAVFLFRARIIWKESCGQYIA